MRMLSKLNQTMTTIYITVLVLLLWWIKNWRLKWLYKALHLGWVEVKHIKVDTDLTNLHTSKKWNKLILL